MNQIAIPKDVRALLEAPNYVHLTTLRKDGSPRSHVVWVWVEDDQLVIGTHEWSPKARDMKRDPRVALSVIDLEDPYRMAALRGRVVEVRPDDHFQLMDRVSVKYINAPFPVRECGLVYFVIDVENAYQRTLDGFRHNPGETASASA